MSFRERGGPPLSTSRRSFVASAGAGLVLGVAGIASPQAGTAQALDVRTAEAAGSDSSAVVADPGLFVGIDPTGATSSSAGLTRAIQAVPDGGRLVFPAGTYALDTRLDIRGKSMAIDLGLAELRLVGGPSGAPPTGAIDARGEYETVYGVRAIEVQNVKIDDRDLRALKITLSAAPTGFLAGDVVKLVADDRIAGSRPGSGGAESRAGEFLIVHSVSQSELTVLSDGLLDSYTKNVRLAKLKLRSVHVRGGRITTDSAGMNSWTVPTVLFKDLITPSIKGTAIAQATSQHVQVMGCYGYLIEDCVFGYAPNEPTRGRLGYGVLDNSSAYGIVRGVLARDVRHAYTDDTPRVPAGDANFGAYGRTYKTKIIDSHCHSSSGISWDTHSASQGVEFIGCSAVGSGPAGFGLRGRRHRVSDCEVVGAREGILVYTEDSGTESWGHVIDGLVIRDIAQNAINVVMNAQEARRTVMRNIRVERAPQLLYAKFVSLELSGISFLASSELNDGAASLIFNACVVDGDNWSLDYRENGNGAGLIGMTVSTGSDVTVNDVRVRYGDASRATRFAYFARASNVSPLSRVVLQRIDFDVPPGPTSTGPVLNAGSTDASSAVSWIAFGGSTGFSSAHLAWSTSVTTAEPHGANSVSNTISRTIDQSIFVAFNVEYHSTLFTMKRGRLIGQQLQWMNISTSKNLTVRHGPATFNVSTSSGQDVVLKPGNRMRLLWTGSVWQQI